LCVHLFNFFVQAEDGIRDRNVTGVQTCALPIWVVGPIKSVERILEVAKEFQENLSFVPFIYHTATETIDIIKENYDGFEYFLFSGPIPYEIAKQTKQNTNKFFYIHLLETGFYKALLQLMVSTKKEIKIG